MTMNLLPNGLSDLLPEIAEKEANAIHTLMMFFKSGGYSRIKPPLIEFEDTLLQGPGQSTSQHMFRVMDPKSQKMMGLRADITPQIARIAATRYNQNDYPLRFAYAGDVLHVKGTQLDPTRQFTQVGCELIGEDTVKADVESIILTIEGLRQIEKSDITLDITLPTLLRRVVSQEDNIELFKALENKNREKIKQIGGHHTELLLALLSMSGNIDHDIKQLRNLNASSEIKEELERLEQVVHGVRTQLEEKNIQNVMLTIDPTQNSFFDYHRGVSFTLYMKGITEVVGRGGRYNFDIEQGKNSAIGFTIYMNALRQLYQNKET